MARLSIYDATSQRFLTDYKTLCPRNWVKNGIGEAAFSVPYNSPKYRDDYLRPGNWVVIHDASLPVWDGIISDDMDYGSNALTLKCFQSIKRLASLTTQATEVIHGSPGELAEQIIHIINRDWGSPFRVGAIFNDGVTKDLKLGDFAYNHIANIAARSGHAWATQPIIEDGQLYIQFDWLQTLGTQAATSFSEGFNMERGSNPLSQRGPIVNSLLAQNDATVPSKRLAYLAEEETSIGIYGRRQDRKTYTGVTTLAALIDSATADVTAMAYPRQSSQVTALNKGNTFYDLRLGNQIFCHWVKVGFSGGTPGISAWFEILGMKTNDKGRCELTLRRLWDVA